MNAGQSILDLIPVFGDKVGHGDLCIGICLGRYCIQSEGDERLLDFGDAFACHEHHPAQWLTDNAVQSDKYGEGDESPEAAGHRVDTFLAVKLLSLFIQFLLISLMSLLELLQLGLQT